MKKYLKQFILRGLIFSGFGPLIAGIVYLILSFTLKDFILSGVEAFIGILSTYILAFVHAGASIFNQIEKWPVAKSLAFHLAILYIAYLGCYLLNSWIPFEIMVIVIFTAIFFLTYFIIWLIVYLVVKMTSKKMNNCLNHFSSN